MNCDRIAPFYRLLEYLVFGRALQKRRLEYIPEVSNARSVLILGDGDGRFTAEFLKHTPATRIHLVDSSAGMLRLARRRAGQDQRLQFLQADARTAEFNGPYDLVVTHFFLDCFTDQDVRRVIARVEPYLARDARWLVSEFRASNPVSALLIAAMYVFFRWTTGLQTKRLPNYHQALEWSGFKFKSGRTAARGLLVSEIYSMP